MDFVVFLKQILLHSSKIVDDISHTLLKIHKWGTSIYKKHDGVTVMLYYSYKVAF
jgi:hypothetical protein